MLLFVLLLFFVMSLAATTEQGATATSTIRWIVEWVLIGAIGVLVVFIIRLLVSGKKMSSTPYKPQRAAAKIFLTKEELLRYDGSDAKLPVYIAIRGLIYDVSARRDLYGTKDKGYNCLAGHDASRALAKHSLDAETVKDCNIDDLTKGELEALDSWEGSYKQKYACVGEIVKNAEDKKTKEVEEKNRYDAETQRLNADKNNKAKM